MVYFIKKNKEQEWQIDLVFMDKYLESMNTARQLEDTIKEYENERIKQLIKNALNEVLDERGIYGH